MQLSFRKVAFLVHEEVKRKMEEKNVCPICGEPTSVYMGNARKDKLCRNHAKQLKEGILLVCEDCGKYYEKGKICGCHQQKDLSKYRINYKCLFCGNETKNGNLFCISCYSKYNDKTITVSIKDLYEFKVVDEYGNRDVKTCNGLYVRSQQEKIIYDELYRRNIRCEYEKPVFYKDDEGVTQTIHPDFYLPDFNLYIEHWGYEDTNDRKYLKTKEYKENIFKKLGYNIVGTSSMDIKDIQTSLDRIFFDLGIVVK